MRRHVGFGTRDELVDYLRTMAPAHAFFSTAYYDDPAAPTMGAKGWAGADLIFDLDADHMLRPPFPPYPVMLARVKEETRKLLDLLTAELGFAERDLQVVFSGGRGYHIHVKALSVRQFSSAERRELINFVCGIGLDPALLGFAMLIGVFGMMEVLLSNLEPIVMFLGIEDYVRLNTLESGSGRYFAWEFAWEHIQEYLVFGGGFANDERVMRKHRLYLERMGHQGGVHNSYLSFWFDVGAVGLALYLRSFILAFIKSSKMVPMSLGVMFAVLFSITYESWLVSSLNPYTIVLLIILTVVSEEEIVLWDKPKEALDEHEVIENDPPLEEGGLPAIIQH